MPTVAAGILVLIPPVLRRLPLRVSAVPLALICHLVVAGVLLPAILFCRKGGQVGLIEEGSAVEGLSVVSHGCWCEEGMCVLTCVWEGERVSSVLDVFLVRGLNRLFPFDRGLESVCCDVDRQTQSLEWTGGVRARACR